MVELSAEELSILEIVAQKSSMHTLAVLDQVKQMAMLTGAEFSKDHVLKVLRDLHDRGLVEYIERLDSWKITEEGKMEIL